MLLHLARQRRTGVCIQHLCQLRELHWGTPSGSSNPTSDVSSTTWVPHSTPSCSDTATDPATDAEAADTLISGLIATVAEQQQQQLAPHLGLFTAGAAGLDALHTLTGLPWWAVIPTTAVAVKTLLLPLSLKQAKIIRMNMVLWTEAHEFQKQRRARLQRQLEDTAQHALQQQQQSEQLVPQQEQQQQQQPANLASSAPHATDAAAAALQQLQHWQERLQMYHDLRRKCDVPHPAWLFVNSLLQFPIFVYTAASIRTMAQADWPGFSTEGALWFSNLTKPAMVLLEGGSGVELPMGALGLVLPLALTGVMLTTIHLGFKASGTAARHPSISGTWLSTFLTCLRPLLYLLTVASAAVKVQLPHAAVLHWMATSSYTLGLQLGLKSPWVRQLLGYSLAGSSGSSQGVDPGVLAQAAAVDNADVLVVMGAKHAALQRYAEAMHCLGRALQLDPKNARAHYSAGQIHALQHHWSESEDSYRKCAELSTDPHSVAQALYCVAVACHQQGNHRGALQAYQHASAAGPADPLQPMLALGTARALKELGEVEEAAAVAAKFLASKGAAACPAVVAEAMRALAGETGSTGQERQL